MKKARRNHAKRTTIEQDIIASLKKRVSPDDLEDKDWLQFKSQMREGDEIWYYITSRETWTMVPHCGREGYVLVRDDKVVDEIILSIS